MVKGIDYTVWQSPELAHKFLSRVRQRIPYADDQLQVMLRVIRGLGRPVRSFLDLGCGDGILASVLLDAYPEAEGALVDFSAPMLDAAREKLAASGPRLRYLPLDFAEPAWLDGLGVGAAFDAVVSGYAIHHQPDERKRALYGEILGLLAPGGVFVNVEHVASETPAISSLSDELFIDTFYALLRAEGKSRDEVARDYHDRPDKAANLLAPVEEQCEWLRRLGYEEVSCFFKVFELAVFGGRRPR